jgi:hypothetical protein
MISTSGTASAVQISHDNGSTGPNIEVSIVQNSQPFVETSLGISLAVLPFNNYISASMIGKALVNLDGSKSVLE